MDVNRQRRRNSKRLKIESSTIIIIALFALVMIQLYAYAISDWEIVRNEWNLRVMASKMAVINKAIIFPRYIAFFLLFTVAFCQSVKRQLDALYTFVFLSLCFSMCS